MKEEDFMLELHNIKQNVKNEFIDTLTEKYGIIVDFRCMEFGWLGVPTLFFNDSAICKEADLLYYPKHNGTLRYELSKKTINEWNDKVKDEIKKLDNIKKLIDKI